MICAGIVCEEGKVEVDVQLDEAPLQSDSNSLELVISHIHGDFISVHDSGDASYTLYMKERELVVGFNCQNRTSSFMQD